MPLQCWATVSPATYTAVPQEKSLTFLGLHLPVWEMRVTSIRTPKMAVRVKTMGSGHIELSRGMSKGRNTANLVLKMSVGFILTLEWNSTSFHKTE
jgi:hypothetical protein